MPTDPIATSARGLDLSLREIATTTVVASPALAAETIIAQLAAFDSALSFAKGVKLVGWAAYTVGTTGSAVTLRLRQTGLAGTLIASTGAMTGSQHGAGILSSDDVCGFDTAPAAGQVYVLTLQVTAATAASTVSAVYLEAVAI